MIVACVYTGNKYHFEYVDKLSSMVSRHMPGDYEFVTLTDKPGFFPGRNVKVPDRLNSWWGKMFLFSKEWREGQDVIYLDLDTVVIGDLEPLAKLDIEFGICANFTKIIHPSYRCDYGSCVMKLSSSLDDSIWLKFINDEIAIREFCDTYGDQLAIELLQPRASLLQPLLPSGYFAHYRGLTHKKPEDASLVIFAGRNKPDNSDFVWVAEEWK